jgi:glucose-1-phosphate adenylyltransferase
MVIRESPDRDTRLGLVRPPRTASRPLASDSTAIVLAGGRGERLGPLTIGRAKPAVPFGGTQRILDFTIANCVRSEVRRIHLLTQYESASIENHLRRTWCRLPRGATRIDVHPADLREGAKGYHGTADAVLQNLDLVERIPARFVLVLGGDHVYRMDYDDLLASHARSGAELTIAATEVPLADARRMGVLAVDERWRIHSFDEKPTEPRVIPARPGVALASMGIYAFDRGSLLRELRSRHREAREFDFGKDVIPAMVRRGAHLQAFPFRDPSGHPRYWRDIGTLDSYFAASMDVATARFLTSSAAASRGPLRDATIRRSIVGPGSVIETGAVIDEAVLFDSVRVGRGASIRRAILDEGVQIRAGGSVGLDPEKDRRRFTVTEGGVVVVPRGAVVGI